MKKISRPLFVLIMAAGIAAVTCSINIPYDFGDDYEAYKVRLLVEPEDADVLLNGRFIGEAYEYASWASALKLASRNHELTIKEQGYVEEGIDLREYGTHNITIRLKLLQDPRSLQEAVPVKSPTEPKQPAYEAKTEPPAKPATLQEIEPPKIPPVPVVLDVQPPDAAIYIDGKFWGISPDKGKIENLKLRPGQYLFAVFKPGFKPYQKEIEVPKQEKFAIQIVMEKITP